MYAFHFDAINARYPTVAMLDVPTWRWAALIDAWAAESCSEGKEAELERMLQRPVEWMWIRGRSADDYIGGADPTRWQTNTPGESLISKHRASATEGR